MNNIRQRLAQCFAAVFPTIPPDQLASATADNVAAWDSAHHAALVQVIEEEFQLELPDNVIGETDSFAAFETYLQGLGSAACAPAQ